jgi:hypothetical protein
MLFYMILVYKQDALFPILIPHLQTTHTWMHQCPLAFRQFVVYLNQKMKSFIMMIFVDINPSYCSWSFNLNQVDRLQSFILIFLYQFD